MQFNLNEKQIEAVKHKSGPLLIIAGAGTGKTAVLTQRIIHLISSGAALPSQILALTFTEKAAAEMIERVDVAMPIGYEEVTISTFHSFCDQILRQEGVHIGLNSNYQLMNQAQSYIFFRKNLYNLPLNLLRPLGNPTQNISDILKHFSRLQDEDVSPEEYHQYANSLNPTDEESEVDKQEKLELAAVYKEYRDIKLRESKLDFGDLIITTLRLMRERPNILEQYRDRYKYILVDEFQDTNYTQNVLINMLALGLKPEKASKVARKKANLTVVGDDDQAIYKFRGAAISNILQFNQTYPDSKKVVLAENYRSRQEILDASYQLIKHNNPYRLEESEGINKKLIARAEFSLNIDEPVQLISAESGSEEADLVAKEILALTGNKEKLKDDSSIVEKKYDAQGQGMFIDVALEAKARFKFSDIAILVRANDHAEEFIQTLRYYGIPFKFFGPKSLYYRPEVSVLISFLKILVDYKDDISMFNLLKMSIFGLQAREIIELMAFARHGRISIFESLEQLWNIKLGSSTQTAIEWESITPSNAVQRVLSSEGVAAISTLLMIIDKAFQMVADGRSIGEILYEFINVSGYIKSLTESKNEFEAQFKVQNISKFFELVKSFEKDNPGTTIYEYIDYLNYSIEIGETPKADQELLDEYDAVNIMTVHGSKGLEFPVVFLVNLVSERFPGRHRTDKIPLPNQLIKEELPELTETGAHLQEERRLFYVAATRARELLYLTAAKFYGDAKRQKKTSIFLDEILDRKITQDQSSDRAGQRAAPPAPTLKIALSTNDDSLDITGLGIHLPESISFSHLDSYETCPKQYKYKYVLALPGQPSFSLAFGRSVHNALKDFYQLVIDAQNGLEGVSQMPDLDTLLRLYDMRWVSEGYQNKKHEEERKEVGRRKMQLYYESMFSVNEKPIALEKRFKYRMGDILISGSIDRIDLIKRENGRDTVTLIDYKTGKVKDADDPKTSMQLALYSLAAEELFGMHVGKASFLYVEHGKRIDADISEKYRDNLRKRVKETVAHIRSGDFAAKPGMLCKFCDYRTICADAQL